MTNITKKTQRKQSIFVAKGERYVGRKGIGKGDKEVQTLSCKKKNVTLLLTVFATLYMLKFYNQTYGGNHFEMHRNIESLCCVK